MSRYGIGIDTSCYTTSFAIIDLETLEVVENFQQLLKVKQGEKGLRQSDAFYQHVHHLGTYFENCSRTYFNQVAYVAVSTKPRNRKESYMPVFTAGLNFAKSIAALLDVPLIETDHQSGHLAAALYNQTTTNPKRFLGLHLSGGTTEILDCKLQASESNHCEFDCDIIGGSLDISAGQLIDRIGVALEFDFPCGKAMEQQLIDLSDVKINKGNFPKISKNPYFNLSGGENKGLKLIESGVATQVVIKGVFDYISRQLIAGINALESLDDYDALVLSGGVSANDYICNCIAASVKLPVIRGEKRFCTDNALGVAFVSIMKS